MANPGQEILIFLTLEIDVSTDGDVDFFHKLSESLEKGLPLLDALVG